MIGPTTLKGIREGLRYYLSKDGDDPVEWIKKHMAASPKESDVLKSLLALLDVPVAPKKPKSKPVKGEAVKIMRELDLFQRRLEGQVKPKRKRNKSRRARKR
jgi:hypothetical protein